LYLTKKGDFSLNIQKKGAVVGGERQERLLEYALEVCQDILIIHYKGEIDLASAHIMEETLEEGADRGFRKIIADLSDVEFGDASMLRMLVSFHQKMEDRFGQWSAGVHIICNRQSILKLFAITGLDKLFVMCLSKEEALKSF
jgi:anti-sigma B factor antagonist